jgi:hypothetical protein
MRNLRRSIISTIAPTALDNDMMEDVEANEAWMAADPEIQRLRAEVDRVSNRQATPYVVGGVVFSAMLCGAAAWFASEIVTPATAVVMFAVLSMLTWKTFCF